MTSLHTARATDLTQSFTGVVESALDLDSIQVTSMTPLHSHFTSSYQSTSNLFTNQKTIVYSQTQQQAEPSSYTSFWEPLIVTTLAVGLVVGLFSLRSQ